MSWLSALIKPLFQVAAESLRDWRRDRALQKLGYNDAQRAMAKKAHKVRQVWRDVDIAKHIDAVERLRGNTF